jgi:hypothetical protein
VDVGSYKKEIKIFVINVWQYLLTEYQSLKRQYMNHQSNSINQPLITLQQPLSSVGGINVLTILLLVAVA